MVTVSELYAHLRKALEQGGIEDSPFEAMCMTEELFGIKLQRLLLSRAEADDSHVKKADEMVFRRCSGEPLQYILGKWEFYGLPFYVGEGVLIPRQDTETLVDLAIERCSDIENPKILDLCSGSGCVAIALDKHLKGDITAVEISDRALYYLEKNAVLNSSSINIVKGDVTDKTLPGHFRNLDMIVCNPPYLTSEDMKALQKEVAFEPESALFGGSDGLDFYRSICALWHDSLRDLGIIAFEAGLGQERELALILENSGFKDIEFREDLTGRVRVTSGRKYRGQR